MLDFIRRKKLTRLSIKESYDNLPTGLCFAYESGMPLLVNTEMHRLCHKITGQSLQNANEFRRIITKGNYENGITCVSNEGRPVLRFPDGEYRTFTFSYITPEGKRLLQISAENTTDLYVLVEKLDEENKALEQHGERLRKYNESIQELTIRREYLATKMRVHDQIGRALLQTRHILNQGVEYEDRDAVLKSWQDVVDMLNFEILPRTESSAIKHLADAAEAIGVKLKISKNLPQTGKIAEIIAVVGSEALTNAVRHGKATELEICCTSSKEYISVRYTSNGIQPEAEISEAGGLSNLRCKVEAEGGKMVLEYHPKYSIRIDLPLRSNTYE